MNNSYGSYLEELRTSRKLTKEKFVEGIMSERQYRRYINDESQIPNDKLLQLVDKLGTDVYGFMTGFEKHSSKLLSRIKDVYSLIRTYNFKEAEVLHNQIEFSLLTKQHQIEYYQYNEISIKLKLKKISSKIAYDKLCDLIDYPRCLSKKSLSFIELVSLLRILDIKKDVEHYEIIGDYLLNFLIDESFDTIGSDNRILPSIYSIVSRILLGMKKYDKCYRIARYGVSYCDKFDVYNSIYNLLFFSAYSCFMLDKNDELEFYLKRLRGLLEFKSDEEYKSIFEKEIEKMYRQKKEGK